jgi:nitroreductase
MATNLSSSAVTAGKYADTRPSVDELFRARWSPRSFSSRAVSNEDLEAILDAGRWAASSYNEQPWRFVVATKADPAAYAALLSILVPFNQEWAKSAPVLILTAAHKNFSHSGKPNYYALHDTGAALAQMMLQATALGLHAHGMAGFDHAKARELLAIPHDFEIGAVLAIGYLGSPDQLPNDQMKQQEVAARVRKPLSELAFSGRWGKPLVT